MNDIKIKPCPFCGGEAHIKWEDWKDISPNSGVYVLSVDHKNDCYFVQMNGMNYKSRMISSSEERLLKTWNTRKPIDRIVEQLEELQHVNPFLTTIEYKHKAIEIARKGGVE